MITKALQKKGVSPPKTDELAGNLRVLALEMDNAGITVLYYHTADLVPNKRVAVAFDVTGEIHLAQLAR